jgi:hypothetical protein
MELLAGEAVPVVGVPGDSLFAMEIGMDSHGAGGFEFVDTVMSSVPVSFCIPPESFERWVKLVGWAWVG